MLMKKEWNARLVQQARTSTVQLTQPRQKLCVYPVKMARPLCLAPQSALTAHLGSFVQEMLMLLARVAQKVNMGRNRSFANQNVLSARQANLLILMVHLHVSLAAWADTLLPQPRQSANHALLVDTLRK